MPSTTSYCFVRSADRTMGTSSAFVVKLPQTYQNITSISLVSAELAFSMYNVDVPYTSGVRFTHNSVPYDMVLTAGFYQVDDLRGAVLTALQAAFPTAGFYAVNYSTMSGKLSISYTSGLTLTAQSMTGGSLGKLLGTDPLGTTAIASSGTLTMPYLCMLFPTTSMFVRVAELPCLTTTTNSINAFARLQLSSAPGSVVMANNATGVVNTNYYTTPVASLSSLTVSLVSIDGYAVNLNQVDWSFTILINHFV